MMDQRAKYSHKGLLVEFVGDEQECNRRIVRGDVQLLFISPESALGNKTYRAMFLSQIYKDNLVGLIVDEAHCVQTWGDEFRRMFAQVGELRSLFPAGVKVMALTATTTTDTFTIVSRRLSMCDPIIVALPPNKDNITYKVHEKIDLDVFTTMLCCGLNKERMCFPKTIIYVRTYTDCINMYLAIKGKIGDGCTEPPGYPNLAQYRIIDMFTRVLTSDKKEEVISLFSQPGGKLRLIIATSAFGMGIDIPDIHQIIHWGMPASLEEYVQESGRSGRDQSQSVAVVYRVHRMRNTSIHVQEYEANSTVCRRKLLFRRFLMFCEENINVIGCLCCDICAKSCNCSKCI